MILRPEAVLARLRDLGIAETQDIEDVKGELAASRERVSAILVRRKLLRDAEAGRRLASQFGTLPQSIELPVEPPRVPPQVPLVLWSAHRLLPLGEDGGRLVVATDDPLSVFALEFFSRQCGQPLDAILIREQQFVELLTRLERAPPSASGPRAPATPPPKGLPELGRGPGAPAEPIGASPKAQPPGPAASAGPAAAQPSAPRAASEPPPPARPGPIGSAAPARAASKGASGAESGDEPIIQLVDSMLAEAVRMRASDIHIEPAAQQTRVRYRIDGVLRDVNSPPKALHGPVVSRLKIMAGLNIAERRLPQDGRLQLVFERRPLDVRVSSLPAMHGESVVLRLLDRSQPVRGLAEMGLLPDDQQRWEVLIHRPHGMVLVTGPTGSGKTTTLYGAMVMLNRPDRKLITVEDPVEYQLAGVNQVLVRPAVGLTFAAGLRAMLRQAPDVILVGEIRDQETAQIAVQAALTGHLVLSTLHTNDAPSAVTRLIDMGIAPFLAASTLQGILAQRLVRRICEGCRITDNATEEERRFLGEPEVSQVIRSTGCERCRSSGFVGRIGIFELLMVSERLRQLIVAKANASEIRAVAVADGMRGLRADGCVKIREGLTTMAEVLRVAAEAEV